MSREPLIWTQYREPNLLVPGRKPIGSVKVNRSHFLARGLVAYWHHIGKGDIRDLMGGRHISLVGAVAVAPERGSIGLDYSAGNSAYGVIDNSDGVLTCAGSPITFCAILGPQPGTQADNICGINKQQWWLATNLATVDWWVGHNTKLASSALPTDRLNVIVGRADGSTSKIFVNGVENATVGRGNLPIASTNDIYSGVDPRDQSGYNATKYIHYMALWCRALSVSEIGRLTKDPYQFLESANDAPFLVSAAAPAAEDLLLLEYSKLRGGLQDLSGGLM